jgi:hypothetical protein
MMKLRKSRVNLAVGAVLSAAALIPASSFGWSVDTVNGTLLTASGGDTLLFPIYTTVNPATTSFSVTNTSGETIAAKIRFREQDKSMDVLDFIVVLSPYDKFDFSVSQGVDDVRPTMSWNDNTCLVGPGTGGSVQFPPPSAFVSGNETMSVGHLEVLGMATLDNYAVLNGVVVPAGTAGSVPLPLADAAEHGSDGVPANCGLLVTWLATPGNVNLLNQSGLLRDVPNVLVGRYVITGAGLGIEAGGDAIGIRDSNLGPGAGPIPMSAQSSARCDAIAPVGPPANCTGWYAWDKLEWDHPHLAEMPNLVGFQNALTAANISGDWSNNPANDVGVDWVLSFPNKYAYLDLIPATACEGGAGSGTEWCLLYAPRGPFGLEGVWTATGSRYIGPTPVPADGLAGVADLCIGPSLLDVWDREEQQAAGSVSVSPGAQTQLELCKELEVFTLAAEGQAVRDSVIQVPDNRRVITFENLDAIRGWARMTVPWATVGDSVTGILFTTRNTDDPLINNGSLTDLQKDVGGAGNTAP